MHAVQSEAATAAIITDEWLSVTSTLAVSLGVPLDATRGWTPATRVETTAAPAAAAAAVFVADDWPLAAELAPTVHCPMKRRHQNY